MISLYSGSSQPSEADSHDEREEVVSLRLQVTALKESLRATRERHAEVLRQEREATQDANHEVEALYSQIDLLKKKVIELQQKHVADLDKVSADKDAAVSSLTNTVEALTKRHKEDTAEKEEALQETYAARAACEEAEEHLKIAHHHLSKKVRETTELAEKLKALQMIIDQSTAALMQKNETVEELEGKVLALSNKERAIYRELQALKKTMEERQAEWEGRLTVLQSELDLERADKERMRVYEERCHHIARYWDSMGKVLWEQRPGETAMSPIAPSHGGSVPRSAPRAYQNLLDLSLVPHKTTEDPAGIQ